MIPAAQALRRQTRAAHDRTEQIVDIHALLGQSTDADHYARIIATTAHCWLPLRAQLTATGLGGSLLDALQRDAELLQPQGATSSSTTDPDPDLSLPALDDQPFWQGVRYVFLGSALGGKIIYRHLSELPHIDWPLHFYRACSDFPAAQWSSFRQQLNEQLCTSEQQAAAIEAANWAFKRFEAGF